MSDKVITSIPYEVTARGDRFRSASDLLADEEIQAEMKKTSQAFDSVNRSRQSKGLSPER